jgi:hypothetical protein
LLGAWSVFVDPEWLVGEQGGLVHQECLAARHLVSRAIVDDEAVGVQIAPVVYVGPGKAGGLPQHVQRIAQSHDQCGPGDLVW